MFGNNRDDTLRVEGFDSILRGRRFLVVGDEMACLKRLNLLERESLYKGRSILIIHETPGKPNGFSMLGSIGRKRWDVIFRVRDAFEAQMLATYVANVPKPVRIVWISSSFSPGSEIPKALWQRWANSDVTLIGLSPVESATITCEWEAILFPHRCSQTIIEKYLAARGSGLVALASRMKEHYEEIAASGAALVWSSIDGSAIYWYDPTEGTVEEGYTKQEAATVLEGVRKWLLTV